MADFSTLLSFHQPAWVPGAEYYANTMLVKYKAGVPCTLSYPEHWFAGKWERVGLSILTNLLLEYGEVTTEAFADAVRTATGEAT